MNTLFYITLVFLVALVYSQSFATDMCGKSDGVYIYVNRDGDHFKLKLPSLVKQNNLNNFPNITCSGTTYPNCPVDKAGYSFCYVNGQIHKKNPQGTVVKTRTIASSSDSYNLLLIDPYVPNTLHVTTWPCFRGCSDQVYTKLTIEDLNIVSGPTTLSHSAISGCPVAPTGCAVFDIQFITASNDYLIYGYRYDQNLTYYVSALNTRCNSAPIALYQLPQHE
jgi:hypothetical protein